MDIACSKCDIVNLERFLSKRIVMQGIDFFPDWQQGGTQGGAVGGPQNPTVRVRSNLPRRSLVAAGVTDSLFAVRISHALDAGVDK